MDTIQGYWFRKLRIWSCEYILNIYSLNRSSKQGINRPSSALDLIFPLSLPISRPSPKWWWLTLDSIAKFEYLQDKMQACLVSSSIVNTISSEKIACASFPGFQIFNVSTTRQQPSSRKAE